MNLASIVSIMPFKTGTISLDYPFNHLVNPTKTIVPPNNTDEGVIRQMASLTNTTRIIPPATWDGPTLEVLPYHVEDLWLRVGSFGLQEFVFLQKNCKEMRVP